MLFRSNFTVELVGDAYRLLESTPTPISGADRTRHKIVTAMRQAPAKRWPVADLAALMQLSPDTVRGHLKILAALAPPTVIALPGTSSRAPATYQLVPEPEISR